MLLRSSQTASEAPAQRIGVLLINVGSPGSPSPEAVRAYLAEFLADPRIIDWPRPLWIPLLNHVILKRRPARTAQLYQEIWTSHGSPLLHIARSQAELLADLLSTRGCDHLVIEPAMRYGEPSIPAALRRLAGRGIQRVIAVPLYPQYSTTTTASALDALEAARVEIEAGLELHAVGAYYDHPLYIRALASTVRASWSLHGRPQRLLLSFHGIPVRYVRQGDPYPEHCRVTAEALANALELQRDEWELSYQSRFGPEPWLRPGTDAVLRRWGQEHVSHAAVIAPGFASDCLETLHELDVELAEVFKQAGGGRFDYIPALNQQYAHLELLAALVQDAAQAWDEIGCAASADMQPALADSSDAAPR